MLGVFVDKVLDQLTIESVAIFKIVLTALVTGAAAYIVGINLRRRWHPEERKGGRQDVQRVLCKELHDLERHFMASQEVLDAMGLEWDKKPSAIHFEKMKVPEDALIFSIETMRQFTDLDGDLGSGLFHLKVKLWNRNVEFAHVAAYVRSELCERAILRDHVENMRKQGTAVVDDLRKWKNALHQLVHGEECKWEHNDLKKARAIVFEGPFHTREPQVDVVD